MPAEFYLLQKCDWTWFLQRETERERWGGVVVNLCWSLFDAVWSAVNLPSLWPWHNLREKGTEPCSVIKRLYIKVNDEIGHLTKTARRTLGFLKTVSIEWLAAFSCLLMSWNQIVDTVWLEWAVVIMDWSWALPLWRTIVSCRFRSRR